MSGQPEVVEQAEDAYEAVRRICHITGGPMPAPLLYQVLGNLKLLGHTLPQALRQLGNGLVASLECYDVYEVDGRDPAVSAAAAQVHLWSGAQLAEELGRYLELAQSAISRQGYHDNAAAVGGDTDTDTDTEDTEDTEDTDTDTEDTDTEDADDRDDPDSAADDWDEV